MAAGWGWAIGVVCGALAGCNGAAQLVLKSPIEDRCKDTGLKGCESMTEGIIAYVDGDDRTEAMKKIEKGAGQNAPDQVREFASALRALKGFPGLEQYIGPVLEVAEILAPDEKEVAAKTQRAKARVKAIETTDDSTQAEAEAPKVVVRSVVAKEVPVAPVFAAGTTVPSVDVNASACTPFAETGADIGNAVGRCATVTVGPLVVTDVLTPGGCPNDLFVGAGAAAHPRWALSAMALAQPLGAHGMNLPVSEGESLFVAQVAPTTAAMRRDVKCAITWAGARR